MRVVWTDHARRHKDQVANYIRDRFGFKRKKIFIQQVNQTVKMIMSSPNLGPIDPLFNDRSDTFRSVIINGLSKLVYRIDNDVIHIVGFWDTRQEPEAQAAQVKE